MSKKAVMMTIDEEILAKAKSAGINISNSAQTGILKKLYDDKQAKPRDELFYAHENRPFTEKEIKDINSGYSEDKFITHYYWVNPRNDKIEARGKPQFFINEMGEVRPISEWEYKIKGKVLGVGRGSMIFPTNPELKAKEGCKSW